MEDLARFNLIGQSQAFVAAMATVEKFAASDLTVMVHGETGTGKELAARAIHYMSARHEGPFIPVNCGALPDALVECELFGYVRGAFTDARETHPGLIAQANGGTLFLDEIEAMNAHAQVSLLRFLQDKEYRPLGAACMQRANVRIVGTTNADLAAMARCGQFRSDLLFRLNVLSLRLPPLRERPGDVPVLAKTFLDRLNKNSCLPPKQFHPDAFRLTQDYSWPGNVRELENLVAREFVLASGTTVMLARMDAAGAVTTEPGPKAHVIGDFRSAKADAIATFERTYIHALLSKARGNLSLASRLSGKDRSDLGKLLRKHGIARRDFA